MKIDWKAVWEEFDEWYANQSDPDWWPEQAEKIEELVGEHIREIDQ